MNKTRLLTLINNMIDEAEGTIQRYHDDVIAVIAYKGELQKMLKDFDGLHYESFMLVDNDNIFDCDIYFYLVGEKRKVSDRKKEAIKTYRENVHHDSQYIINLNYRIKAYDDVIFRLDVIREVDSL